MIVHCHRLRDRSDIIAARKALKIKERKVKSFTFLSFYFKLWDGIDYTFVLFEI